MMVMGHIGFGDMFSKFIHGFHMQMFFIISGFFYKDDYSIVKLIRKRAKALLIPYVVFGFFHTIIYFVGKRCVNGRFIYLFLWGNTEDGGVAIAGALWFLTTMFFAETLYALIMTIPCSEVPRHILVIFSVVFGMCFPSIICIRLPFGLDVALVSVGFLHIGRCLKNKFKKLIELNAFTTIFLLLICTVSIIWLNIYVNMRDGNYGIWPLFWMNSVGMTIGFWNLFRLICVKQISSYQQALRVVSSWLKDVGKESIVYLCLNQLFIYASTMVITHIYTDAFTKILILVVVLLELYVAQIIITKTPIKVTIGRF